VLQAQAEYLSFGANPLIRSRPEAFKKLRSGVLQTIASCRLSNIRVGLGVTPGAVLGDAGLTKRSGRYVGTQPVLRSRFFQAFAQAAAHDSLRTDNSTVLLGCCRSGDEKQWASLGLPR
jgi:hypothetical protein